MAIRTYILIFTGVLLTGCANFSSIYRQKDLSDDVTIVSVDAKQRFLINTDTRADTDGKIDYFRRVCVEPSPDVFSAFAAAFEGSAQTEAFEAALKASFSENAATIGLRTQAIQLLRDGMFRLCEGVLNDSIDKEKFVDLHQRYQRIMVTLVAIEQLTGAVAHPPVTIQTSAYTGGPARLPGLQNDLKVAQEQLKDAEVNLASKSDSSYPVDGDGDGTPDSASKCSEFSGEVSDRPTECSEYFKIAADVEEKKESVESIEKSIDAAQDEIVTSASGSVTLGREFAKINTISDTTALKLSSTISEMVDSLFVLDPDTAINKFEQLQCTLLFSHASVEKDIKQLESEKILLEQSDLSIVDYRNQLIRDRGDIIGVDVLSSIDRAISRSISDGAIDGGADQQQLRIRAISEVDKEIAELRNQKNLLANEYYPGDKDPSKPSSLESDFSIDICEALAHSVNKSLLKGSVDQ